MFVGGEEEIEPQKDSKIELQIDERSSQNYSLHHAINLMMSKCKLENIKFQLYTGDMAELPWDLMKKILKTIDFNMRITDSILIPMFRTELKSLKRLILSRAEISDDGLKVIGDFCKNLEDIVISIVPFQERSRYLMSVDPRTSAEVSNCGLNQIMELSNIKRLHISPLYNVTPEVYLNTHRIPLRLSEISLTLSNRSGVSGNKIIEILNIYGNTLIAIRLHGNKNNDRGSFTDSFLPENFILGLPVSFPKLRQIVLVNLDISRIDPKTGINTYYGLEQSSWMADMLYQEFRNQYPSVDFKILK